MKKAIKIKSRQASQKKASALKDFLIPHVGNNYHPHALHQHRLLWHAFSAISVKLALILFISFLPIEAWLSPDALTAQASKIISLTNDLRRAQQLPELKENNLLNEAAYRKSADMLTLQYFAHISPSGLNFSHWIDDVDYRYDFIGENLAIGFSLPEEVLTAWEKSPTHYDNLVDRDFVDIGVAVVAGDYQNVETTLVTQYFGRPSVLAVVSQKLKNIATESSPVITKTKVYLNNVVNKKEKVVVAKATLPSNTKTAVLKISDYQVSLEPQGNNQWQGTAVIAPTDSKTLVNPAVNPTLITQDVLGQTKMQDVPVDNLVPVKSTIWDQYTFVKNQQPAAIKALFDFTSGYYQILLGLVMLCLVINIVVEFRKQRVKAIASACGLMAVLVVLIII